MWFIENSSFDPFYNLALEEALLSSLRSGGRGFFMLWQNSPSVIIGRHQNAMSEVNHEQMLKDNIRLVRRMSGGGAVYHDLGNLNFSFIWPGESLPEEELLRPLMSYLGGLGLAVSRQGRNDLMLEGAGKFSGLASLHSSKGWLLHGTILYDVDLSALERILRVDPEKYRSKGVESLRARVCNLRPYLNMSLEQLREGIRRAYKFKPKDLSGSVVDEADRLCRDKYSQRIWNLGQSPPVDIRLARRFSFGSLELCLRVEKNVIVGALVNGDFFAADMDGSSVPALGEALLGLPADERGVWARAWSGLDLKSIFSGCDQPEVVLNWLGRV